MKWMEVQGSRNRHSTHPIPIKAKTLTASLSGSSYLAFDRVKTREMDSSTLTFSKD